MTTTPTRPGAECATCTVPTSNPDGGCDFCRDYTPPGADHHPAVRQSLSSGCWLASCSCGWQWLPCITEDTAREAMAVHYLGADPLAADPDGALLAAMRRHPAGSQR